jgi:regulator of sirC expression with transglutaminase-like and TPR domain
MSPVLQALAQSSPRIEEVALAIAQDEYPGLAHARYHALLDELAGGLGPLAPAPGPERLARFTEHVYGRLGFHGNADDYYDPKNSYLNEVLERRSGIPITLAVVLMAIGRRVGLVVEGIGFPGHFLVRIEGLLVDPFNEGQIVEHHDLMKLARRFGGDDATVGPAELEAVGPRTMAVRMLFNLQQIYERRGDHARALVVCDRLVDLTGAPYHQRDRGMHALALGAAQAARPDLEAYLSACPKATDGDKVRSLLEKARRGAERKLN